jgi:hypothetical protein
MGHRRGRKGTARRGCERGESPASRRDAARERGECWPAGDGEVGFCLVGLIDEMGGEVSDGLMAIIKRVMWAHIVYALVGLRFG